MLVSALLLGFSKVHADSEQSASVENIQRDVVVVGAGAAGSYAATLLKSLNKTFAVVEKKAEFGGQTETFIVPGSNQTIDYGVEAFVPLADGSYQVIQDFFGAYDVPITYSKRSETGSAPNRIFDFRTATELTNFTYSTDLSAYATQANKYPWIGEETQTPNPLPADLLLPFGDFITKYSLQDEVFNIYYNVEGLGSLLSLPTYYVIRELNSAHLLGLSPSSQGVVITANHFNQQVYLRAQAAVGADALVNSTVSAAQRSDHGVTVTVAGPTGKRQTISASKLLICIPPTPANMAPFNPDSTESGLFGKWAYSGWWVALVNATGFPADLPGIQNAGSDTKYNFPVLPAVYQISPTSVSGIYLVRYGADSTDISESEVQSAMLSSVSKIRAAIVGDGSSSLPAPSIVAFANHSPYDLHVSAQDLQAGFGNQLGQLQGRHSTWYSGAAWFGSSSPDIWNGTHGVVMSMFA